jgi:hypothetical protein
MAMNVLMWAVPVAFLIMGYALLGEGEMAPVAIGAGLILAVAAFIALGIMYFNAQNSAADE